MYIFKAAVIGAGTMGAEIAQVISYSGLPVVLKDVDQKFLDKGMAHIRGIYQARVDKGKMSAGDMADKMDLIIPALDYDEFGDVDIIVEAVPEKMAIKGKVLQELNKVAPPETIFASNTSALSISEMGKLSGRPEKMIGMHFFNPAHVMKLVEIIPGLDTSQETVDDVTMFVESLRKIPVLVQECPGFLVNRLLMPYLNEATYVAEEGSATLAEVDQAMVDFGMPMGPFTLMDMLGIDVCADVGQYLYSQYGKRVEPAPLFFKLLDENRLGEKNGAGFYGYGGKADAPVAEMAKRLAAEGHSLPKGEFSVERLVYPLINEAVLCVQENIAAVPDIDMAMIAGTGMTYKGERIGPLGLADTLGLDVVLAGLEKFQAQYGERFQPAVLLRTKVKAGHLGKKTGRGFHEYS